MLFKLVGFGFNDVGLVDRTAVVDGVIVVLILLVKVVFGVYCL